MLTILSPPVSSELLFHQLSPSLQYFPFPFPPFYMSARMFRLCLLETKTKQKLKQANKRTLLDPTFHSLFCFIFLFIFYLKLRSSLLSLHILTISNFPPLQYNHCFYLSRESFLCKATSAVIFTICN